jgi:hypothetical protein
MEEILKNQSTHELHNKGERQSFISIVREDVEVVQ